MSFDLSGDNLNVGVYGHHDEAVEGALKFLETSVKEKLDVLIRDIANEKEQILKKMGVLASVLQGRKRIKDLSYADELFQMVKIAFLADPFPRTDTLTAKVIARIRQHEATVPSCMKREAKTFVQKALVTFRKNAYQKLRIVQRRSNMYYQQLDAFANFVFSRAMHGVDNKAACKPTYMAAAAALRFFISKTPPECLDDLFPGVRRRKGIFWPSWKLNVSEGRIKLTDPDWVASLLERDARKVSQHREQLE